MYVYMCVYVCIRVCVGVYMRILANEAGTKTAPKTPCVYVHVHPCMFMCTCACACECTWCICTCVCCKHGYCVNSLQTPRMPAGHGVGARPERQVNRKENYFAFPGLGCKSDLTILLYGPYVNADVHEMSSIPTLSQNLQSTKAREESSYEELKLTKQQAV